MFEVPKMLYGPRGWADLDDYRIVRNEAEEAAAARDGYFRAGEDARRDLIAGGEWPRIVPSDGITTGVASDIATDAGHNAPRRRGRPPKVA